MVRKTALAAATLALSLGLYASGAQAAVAIGLQQAGINGGALTTVEGPDASGFADFTGNYGTFTINSITVSAPPASVNPIDSTALNISSSTPDTLSVYVTSTDLTWSGVQEFRSSLTSNTLPQGWSVEISTFLDNNNALFGTTTPLASQLFNTIGTHIDTDSVNVDGLFSVTGIYTLTSTGVGTALSTLQVETTDVSEPASLALLGGALLGMWGLARRRAGRRT